MGHLTGDRAIATAAFVARAAHAGQVDKAGQPYIDHPRRVAEYLIGNSAPWEQVVVGWLHDVVEDTHVTLEAIQETFGPDIAAAVDAITRRPEERHNPQAYYERVKANEIALAVKCADIADNVDPGRLAALPVETADRLRTKYVKALAALVA